jgi:hypothetical protein
VERPDDRSETGRWRAFTLARLARFTRLAGDARSLPVGELRLAYHAMFAAYVDCVAMGMVDQADEIISANARRDPR